jgi:hypothetical protein
MDYALAFARATLLVPRTIVYLLHGFEIPGILQY